MKHSTLIVVATTIATALALACSSRGQTPNAWPEVVVDGAVVPADRLGAPPSVPDTLTVSIHGAPPQRYSGIPLRSLLRRAGVRVDSLRGRDMAGWVVLEARDRYQVVLSAGELDSAIVPRRLLLADRAEGKPLGDDEGPWRVLVEGDRRPARWIRQLVRIRIERLAAPKD